MSERDSEKELILGNSQLISLFFVVVALCGVFFALGYMIGRNSTKTVVAGMETTTPAPSSSAPVTREEPPVVEAAPAPQPEATPALSGTQPARDMPASTSPAPAAPVKPAATPPPAPVTTAEAPPEAGATYLQVAALRHDDAAKLVKTLREQELPARVADSPKPEIFRVLVGPYHQTAQVAEAKARLKALGFANAFVQK